jgi:hypothetical protein
VSLALLLQGFPRNAPRTQQCYSVREMGIGTVGLRGCGYKSHSVGPVLLGLCASARDSLFYLRLNQKTFTLRLLPEGGSSGSPRQRTSGALAR